MRTWLVATRTTTPTTATIRFANLDNRVQIAVLTYDAGLLLDDRDGDV